MPKPETGKGAARATGAKRPLTAKQEKFCQEYQKDCNATQAAIRAGYKPTRAQQQGSENVLKRVISERIKDLQAKAAKNNGISVQWVLDGLRANAARAMQAEPVLDSKGNPTGEYRYEGSVANRAYELIGKHLGMFSEAASQGEKAPPTEIEISFVTPAPRGKRE